MTQARQDPVRTALGGVLSPSDRRVLSEEEKRKKRAAYNKTLGSYRVGVEIKDAVRQVADSVGVSVSEVVKYFLKYALEAYKAGDLKLEPRPAGKTLFPKE